MINLVISIGLFIFCNVLILGTVYLIIKNFEIDNSLKKCIYIPIMYFFLMLIYELMLGFIVKKLNIYTISITSLIGFLITFLVCKLKKINILEILKKDFLKIKNVHFILNFSNVLFLIFLITFCIISFLSIVTYEYSFDGNYYHLPHIIDYIQNEKISMTNNTLWNNVYPQNIELLNMFYMLFTKSVYFARIPQIVFSLVGMLAIYLILNNHMKFSKEASKISALIYFVTPFIISQITTTYIDGVMISMFIVLIYILLEIFKENRLVDEILYFITLSIFIGIKGTCAIYAVVITLFYVVFKVYNLIKRKEKVSILLLKCFIFLIVVLLVGCNFMILNIIRFNNPIHPFAFLGIDGMSAKVDIGVENEPLVFENKNYIQKLIISWFNLDSGYLDIVTGFKFSAFLQFPDKRVGGMGIFFGYLLLPCFVIAVFLIILKKYKIQKSQLIIFSILLLCFILTPANWWGRYSGFIILGFLITFSIVVDNFFISNKIYKYIMNTIIIIFYLASIYFGAYYAFYNYSNGYYKTEIDVSKKFSEYINNDENKNILLLEESYFEGAKYLVFLKGTHFQNKVNTYYIEEMYKNANVKNHKIETYENFKKLIDESIDVILIVDSSKKRKNYDFLEKFYEENKEKYERITYGENITMCKKIN